MSARSRVQGRRKKTPLFEHGLHLYLEKVFDGITLNILWLLFCIPVITIGASTTAFYYTGVKVLRRERGHLAAEFWRSFKLNFVKGTQLWVIFAVLLLILGINRNIAPDIQDGYFGLFLVCLYTALTLLVLAAALYSFAALSRFNMNTLWILKVGLYMTFRYFNYTLAILAVFGLTVLIIHYLPLFVLGLPCFSLIAISYLMEKVLRRHTPKQEDEVKWYLED
jgi:uncharacterized membrane protein YesL